jgi:hypothetical protein
MARIYLKVGTDTVLDPVIDKQLYKEGDVIEVLEDSISGKHSDKVIFSNGFLCVHLPGSKADYQYLVESDRVKFQTPDGEWNSYIRKRRKYKFDFKKHLPKNVMDFIETSGEWFVPVVSIEGIENKVST